MWRLFDLASPLGAIYAVAIPPRKDTLLEDRAESQLERPLDAEAKKGITAGGLWLLE